MLACNTTDELRQFETEKSYLHVIVGSIVGTTAIALLSLVVFFKYVSNKHKAFVLINTFTPLDAFLSCRLKQRSKTSDHNGGIVKLQATVR